MIACKNLILVQQLDIDIAKALSAIEEKKQKVNRTASSINNDAELLTKKEALLKKIQLRLRKCESDLNGFNEALRLNNIKLSSAGVSPAAYKAIEKENARLSTLVAEAEGKALEDMGKVEALEKDTLKGRKVIEGRRTHLQQIKQRTELEIIEIKKEISDLNTQRSQASLKVEADVLEKYEELARLKKKQVLFAADSSSCPACGMALPASFISAISSCEEADSCPNCTALLYWAGLRNN